MQREMTEDVARAVKYLDAKRIEGTDDYRYWDSSDQSYWISSAESLSILGEMLDDGTEGAYTQWCSVPYSGQREQRVVIDESMMGSEWRGTRRDLADFADALSDIAHRPVWVADTDNGGNADEISEADWNAAIETLPKRCWA